MKLSGKCKLFTVAVLASMILSLSVIPCTALAATSNEDSLHTIRFGYFRLAHLLPIYVALENGYFEEMGIKLEMKPLKSSTFVLSALAAGEIDGGSMSIVPLALAREKGVPVKQVCSFGYSKPVDGIEGLAVLKDSSIQSVKDLEGKKIGGTFKPAEPYFWVINILKKHGVKNYKYIELASTELAATLKAGTIDAARLSEPWFTKMEGQIRIIDHCKDNLCCCGYCFSEKILDNNPNVVRNWLKSLQMGVAFIRENETQARKIMAKYTGVPEDIAMRMTLKPWDEGFRVITDESDEQLGWLVEYGLMKKQPTLEEIYDFRFVGKVTGQQLRDEDY